MPSVNIPYTWNTFDPDSSLTYSSIGAALPDWITLNTSTGVLTRNRTLVEGDIGTTSGHQLRVTDGVNTPFDSNLFTITVLDNRQVELFEEILVQSVAGGQRSAGTINAQSVSPFVDSGVVLSPTFEEISITNMNPQARIPGTIIVESVNP